MAQPGAAPQNFPNKGNLYSNITKPIDISLNFIVDSTNGNGLGIRSLKSNGYVNNVFMHTTQTPATSNGYLNPNPAAGYALIQLKGNFNRYIGGFSGFVTPVATSTKIDNGATLTVGAHYVITTLGNATAAQWLTVGVPAGITPAVGTSFIAIATGAGSGNTSTSRVMVPTTSGISTVEIVGDPNASIANSNSAANGGAWLLIKFDAATSASVTTLIATAPADNSVCGMTIRFDGSSVNVDGL